MNLAIAVANHAPKRRNHARSERAAHVEEEPADRRSGTPISDPAPVAAPALFDGPSTILIVGLGDRGRPHASRFAMEDADTVHRAAAMMGMTTLGVESPALAKLAARLPASKLFASGKAFVPFVGRELYRRLEAYLPIALRIDPGRAAADPAKGRQNAGVIEEAHDTSAVPGAGAANGDGDAGEEMHGGGCGEEGASEQNKYAEAKATKTPRSGKFPEDWDRIAVGHIVLASADRDDGWWTAHVREVKADGTYLLEWEEWSGYPKFTCGREQIALLHPNYDGI